MSLLKTNIIKYIYKILAANWTNITATGFAIWSYFSISKCKILNIILSNNLRADSLKKPKEQLDNQGDFFIFEKSVKSNKTQYTKCLWLRTQGATRPDV